MSNRNIFPRAALLDIARLVLAEGQYRHIKRQKDGSYSYREGYGQAGWSALDATSARALVAVHDALSPDHQVKFVAKMAESAPRAVTLAFALIARSQKAA